MNINNKTKFVFISSFIRLILCVMSFSFGRGSLFAGVSIAVFFVLLTLLDNIFFDYIILGKKPKSYLIT